MTSLTDAAGDYELDSSNSAPLHWGEIVLFPFALAITAAAFMYVLVYDKLLARNPLNSPISMDVIAIRDALPAPAPSLVA